MRIPSSQDCIIKDQYRALTSQAGLIDRSYLTRIKLVGHESLDLLQRISTNDLRTLSPGQSCSTVLTTEIGKIVDLITVYRLDEGSVLVLCHAPSDRVLSWLKRFIITEVIQIQDESAELEVLSIIGPESRAVLEGILKTPLAPTPEVQISRHILGGVKFTVSSIDPEGWKGYNLLVSNEVRSSLSRALLLAGASFGLVECSRDALNVIRIERGLPIYGSELTDEVNPLEAGLVQYVSFTKGCYVGQEVIARTNTYGKLQKRLMGLILSDWNESDGGGIVSYGGDPIGMVTSTSYSVALEKGVALAFIRNQWAQAGKQVIVSHGARSVAAELVDLPIAGN